MGEWEEPAVPHWDFPRAATGIGVLVEAAGRLGVDAREVLRGTGLTVADLAEADLLVDPARELTAIRDLRAALPGRTALAAEVGTRTLSRGASMDAVAAALGVSTRTLRRQLAGEATSYRRLVDEVRLELAERMLATGLLSVEDVALRLGYAEASSFIHAFRRLTGRTPYQAGLAARAGRAAAPRA